MKTSMPVKLRFIATEIETQGLAEQLRRQDAVPRFALARRRPAPPEIEVEEEFTPLEQALLAHAS